MSWIAVGIIGASVLGGAAARLKAGGKPSVPDFPTLDLDALQKLAISGNLSALPGAQSLAEQVNAANRGEVAKAREAAVPGATAKIQKNILDQIEGVADIADTQAALRNLTAANFGLGVGGKSQFSKFGIVGKLGRSVGQQKQQGLVNFANFTSLMDAPRFDPTSMFLSPTQRIQQAAKEAEGQFNVNLARAAIKAQPSRTAQALGAGLGVASNLVGMWAGSMMGGGGGAAAGASAYPSGFGAPPQNSAGGFYGPGYAPAGSVDIPGRFNFPNSSYGKKPGGWWG